MPTIKVTIGKQTKEFNYPKKGEQLSTEKLKELVGWSEPGNGLPTNYDGEYTFKYRGHKVVLKKSSKNRPLRLSLAKRYRDKIHNEQWELNGEPLISGTDKQIISAQHRIVGRILAAIDLVIDSDFELSYEQADKKLDFPTILIEGISPKSADTVDLGQKRTTADVLFRRGEFEEKGKSISDKDAKRLSSMLAGATRLVWLRSQGLNISGGARMEHEDMIAFLEQHPKLHEACLYVDNLNEDKAISSQVSLAYAAGLLYLMGTCNSIAEYDEDKDVYVWDIKTRNWDKAKEFWKSFATGENLRAGDPVLTIRKTVIKIDAGSGIERDTIVQSFVKAWNAYLDDEPLKSVKIKRKEVENASGVVKRVLAEDNRCGGIDLAKEVLDDMKPHVEEEEEIEEEEYEFTGDEPVVMVEEEDRKWKGYLIAQENGSSDVYHKKDKSVYTVPTRQVTIKE